MNKVFLIIQREYLSRVLKKSFLVMTFLVPGLFIAMYALIFFILSKNDVVQKKFTVLDQSGLFINKLHNVDNLSFTYINKDFKEAKNHLKDKKESYLLYIHPDFLQTQKAEILSESKPSFSELGMVESQLQEILQTKKLLLAGIDTSVLNKSKVKVKISTKQLGDDVEQNTNPEATTIIGFISSILIYMSLLIYGTQVMRGVIEEKSSRIIEVIVSSVKPFQLMLGKIIGIGAVGLTQFILWIILSTGLATLTSSSFSNNPAFSLDTLLTLAGTLNLPFILACFLFYYLGGYLIYSALFAAVGSAVDNETETQQFMFPITMPLIFSFIVGMNVIIKNPDSNLSFWLSMIPFTSPIAMMIRIPFGVPTWQLIISMSLLVIGFISTTWVASKIYRVGILMYGKKTNYKEVLKWLRYKN